MSAIDEKVEHGRNIKRTIIDQSIDRLLIRQNELKAAYDEYNAIDAAIKSLAREKRSIGKEWEYV